MKLIFRNIRIQKISKLNVTAYILAGGKSSRMGTDKGLCTVDNKPFISLLIHQLEKITDTIKLVSPIKQYAIFGLEQLEDLIPNKGPLGGVYTALCDTPTEDVIIISCDVPLITSDVLNLLIKDSSDADVVQLATKSHTMPLVAKYKKRIAPVFLKKIQENQLKLTQVLKEVKVKTIVVSEEQEKQLQNINTPEELKQIQYES